MLNKRHKAIAFVTVVVTGISLLAGISLKESIGMFMLGLALAWVVGSETASQTYGSLRNSSGRILPTLRIWLLMAGGGALFALVCDASHFNSSFLTSASMCIWGLLISPFAQLPTRRRWLKVVVWSLGVIVFFVISGITTTSGHATSAQTRRMGNLLAPALIALAVGIGWLAKAWKLILSGIATKEEPAVSEEPQDAAPRERTGMLYASLVAGIIILTISLGGFTFKAFSDSVLPYQVVSPLPTGPSPEAMGRLLVAGCFLLLAWWPYACWKRILEREPNTAPANVLRHKSVTVIVGMCFVVVLSLAVTFGIQNGSDRVTTTQLEEVANGWHGIAVRIGTIKSRHLRTTRDYIEAYEEIGSLLPEYDSKLQRTMKILSTAEQRDRNRGPLNIRQFFDGGNEQKLLLWDNQMFQELRRDSNLTRQEVLAAKRMARLPQSYQVEFWNENFRPMLENERLLRQQMLLLLKHRPDAAAK